MNNDQNMTNKIIGGIAVVAIIAVFFVVLTWSRGGTTPPPGEEPPPFGGTGGDTTPPSGGGTNGGTSGGGGGDTGNGGGVNNTSSAEWAVFDTPKGKIRVSMEKVKNPAEKIAGDRGGVTDRTDAYAIIYFDNQYGRSFLITITSEDTAGARRQAERVFLDTFKVTEEQACALPIDVTTPLWASYEHSGKQLGLSFCPGSVQL